MFTIFALTCLFGYVLGDGCMAPANMVGLLVHDSVKNSKVDQDHIEDPPAKCGCQNAKQPFWRSTLDQLPSDSYKNNETALILDTANECQQLCFCAENQTCYTAQTGKQANVWFIPYCENAQCHMYAVPITGSQNGATYDSVQSEDGTVAAAQSQNTVQVGPSSPYIRVASVGCSGCQNLKNIDKSTCKAGPATP